MYERGSNVGCASGTRERREGRRRGNKERKEEEVMRGVAVPAAGIGLLLLSLPKSQKLNFETFTF